MYQNIQEFRYLSLQGCIFVVRFKVYMTYTANIDIIYLDFVLAYNATCISIDHPLFIKQFEN
jgi:hypothetical protein